MRSIVVFKNQPIELREDGTWSYLRSEGSTIEKLRKAKQTGEIVTFFSGLFDKLGLEVLDTSEKISCILRSGKIDFEQGVDEGSVDLLLPLYGYQVDRLIENAASGFKDHLSRFRIVKEFFNCLPRHSGKLLNSGVATNTTFRKLINSKDLLHLHLTSPDTSEEPDATYTLFFVNGGWNTAMGLSGRPDRTFRVSADDAFDLLRHGFAAEKAGLTDLPQLAAWYHKWREKVEVKAA
jgi:hypothetical protein